ncbi:DUF2723 domain-containing protein [Chloroflexi bacterium TSY]|nr:DUF2723 domain-containing protein [Chloroflexi bacterium TSY]
MTIRADHNTFQEPRWIGPLISTMTAGGAVVLYLATLAPGLTWANHGADGGELIAVAMTNGVPHPPGYPLYIMLLQLWLGIGRYLSPTSELAWLGNLLSALCAGGSVALTTQIQAHLLRQYTSFQGQRRWFLASLGSLAWAWTPLLWGQAIITEVYGLHALLFVFLAWATLVKQGEIRYLLPAIACGIANHLTTVLLFPAIIYWLWTTDTPHASSEIGNKQTQ